MTDQPPRPPGTTAPGPLPVLYSFRRCPYAMRARWALAASGQAYELREVLLRDKPAEMLVASAKGTVPVLVDVDGTVVDQSLEIMLWALERHDPQQWLRPANGTLKDMLELIGRCDGDFKRDLDGYKYPPRAPIAGLPDAQAAEKARDRCTTFLARLEERLRQAPWLSGTHMALSDAAIAPFVRQFAAVDHAWFEVQPWPRLQAWLDALTGSEMFTLVMTRFPRWQTGQRPIYIPATTGAVGRRV